MNPLRLLLTIYAHLERPLLRFNYWLVRSPLVRWPVTRQLLWWGVFRPISYAGAAGQPMTADEAIELLRAAGEEGVIAVGPCGCRGVHRGCDHPIRTDFTVYEGVEAWSRAHPAQYQVISLAEAEAIVRDCRSRGMIQVFYRTGMGGGAGYALCNCCLDGCLPLMNRRAYRNYRFIRGTQMAQVDADRCTACGTCVGVCAFGARKPDGSLDIQHCYGCGLCADICPARAVTMVPRNYSGGDYRPQADIGRKAPKEGDFNRPEQVVTEVTFWGRRPMVGLRRPFRSCANEGCRRRPTPGAKRPKRAISIGLNRR